MSPEDHKAFVQVRRILFVLSGGGIAAVTIVVFSFTTYGMPMTNNSVDGLMAGPIPLAVCMGGFLGGACVHLLEKRGRK